jgi:hypothetical protein
MYGKGSSNCIAAPLESTLTILPLILIGSSVPGRVKVMESSWLTNKGVFR